MKNPAKRLIFIFLSLLGLGVIGLIIFDQRIATSEPHIIQNSKTSIATSDDPHARSNYENRRLIDPATQRVPQGIRQKELQFAQTLVSRASIGARLADSWDRRGPYNVGGRTRALAVKQTDTSVILAGGVSGGVWRTSNGGVTWTKTTGVTDLHSVTAIAEDTTNPGTWYYTTGEATGNSANGGGAFFLGDGVFKSTDDGVSWSLLASTASGTPQSLNNDFEASWNIKIDPTNGNIYVATLGSIHRSTDGGASFSRVLGTFASSYYTDIDISSTGVIYAALSSEGSAAGIHRSLDGTTWTNITSGSFPANYGRIVVDIAPSNENVVYVLANNSTPNPDEHYFWKYTYSSGDGSGAGGAWVDRSANLPAYGGSVGTFDSQGGYDLLVATKPDDENMVFIGGTNLYRSNDAFATAPSSDPTVVNNIRWIGGYSTVNNISQYPNNHPDQHTIVFMPLAPSTMLSGHDGGISKTIDNTANGSGDNPVTWTELNNGYFTTQFYTVAIDHSASDPADTYYNFVMGGLQDNSTWGVNTTGSSDNWTDLFTGDGSYCAISDGGALSYRSFQNGRVFRFTNPFSRAGETEITPSAASGVLFINPFILDPNDNNIMYYAGGASVFRNNSLSTATSSVGWQELTSTTSAIPSGHTVTALGASVNTANTVYFGTTGSSSRGRVFKITNANSGSSPTVMDITSSSVMPSDNGGYVSCIAVDPVNQDNIMVVFSNYGIRSIFYSSDGGVSFTNVSGNLEENIDGTGNGPSVGWATITGNSSLPTFFVGTSTGVYSTSTLSSTSTVWEQEGPSNIGNVVVDMIKIREGDGYVVVGTHGNGVYSFRPPATSDPEISFTASSNIIAESSVDVATGSICSDYRDYTVTMRVANAPTGNETVTLNSSTSTAGLDEDFNFTTNGNFDSPSTELTFADGATTDQTFTVRVYDDAAIESTENIVFTYTISGTSNAIKGSTNQTYTITLNDNDTAPTATTTSTIWSEDWESGPSGWTFPSRTGVRNKWVFTSSACSGQIDNLTVLIVADDDAGSLFCNYSSAVTNPTDEIVYREVDASGLSGLQVTFDFKCLGEVSNDFGSLVYSTNSGASWNTVQTYQGQSSTQSTTESLPASLDGTTFLLGWGWQNNSSVQSGPGFSIDNIVVQSTVSTSVETDLSSSNEEYLGPNATVYFYDNTSGDLMASIQNTSSHDYGCTTVTIDRAGVGAVEGWNAGIVNGFASKSFLVTPTNNNTSGTYNITFYYSEAEIAGWETATGKNRSAFGLSKVSESITAITPSNPGANLEVGTGVSTTAFGDNVSVAASFTTGFSGFGGGDPGVPLPLTLLTFTGENKDKDIILHWTSVTEVNTDFISIERSYTGRDFEEIGRVKAQGNSFEQVNYSYTDKNLDYGSYFYRLRMVDLDGSYEYSKILRVSQSSLIFEVAKIFPNPAIDRFSVEIMSDDKAEVTYKLMDMRGITIKKWAGSLAVGSNSLVVRTGRLSSGSYVLVISNKTKSISRRIEVL